NRLFHGDFVKGVHAHLDVRKLNARLVRLHADLHIRINHPLNGHQNLHSITPLRPREEEDLRPPNSEINDALNGEAFASTRPAVSTTGVYISHRTSRRTSIVAGLA